MFEPRKLNVAYVVEHDTGEVVEFDLHLDENGLLEGMPESGPEWAKAGVERCTGCATTGTYCRAALSITPVVNAFMSLDSLSTVRTRVKVGDRITEATTPISQVVSSLMGLCMASSGCPRTAPFRAMAVYHQPFATLEETIIRAAGFALLGRWAHGLLADGADPFAELIATWADLEEVNLRISRRIQDHCASDASLNGLVNLDMFAKIGGIGLVAALEALKPALVDHPEIVGELF